MFLFVLPDVKMRTVQSLFSFSNILSLVRGKNSTIPYELHRRCLLSSICKRCYYRYLYWVGWPQNNDSYAQCGMIFYQTDVYVTWLWISNVRNVHRLKFLQCTESRAWNDAQQYDISWHCLPNYQWGFTDGLWKRILVMPLIEDLHVVRSLTLIYGLFWWNEGCLLPWRTSHLI